MNKGRILVVDDDLDISNMLRIYFDSQGYEVHVAGRGDHALELCREKLPHVVILDIMLPDLDGYEVLKKLRSNLRTGHIYIMFLTQKDERMDKIAGLELGADDYITKPFDIEELKLHVQNAIARITREKRTHPVTGLPSDVPIKDPLRRWRLSDDQDLLYIGLRGFESFKKAYDWVAGNDVLRFTAAVIGEAVDELGTTDDFIGHTTTDDFVVITIAGKAQAIKAKVTERFATEQVPLITLDASVITHDTPTAKKSEIMEKAAAAKRERERGERTGLYAKPEDRSPLRADRTMVVPDTGHSRPYLKGRILVVEGDIDLAKMLGILFQDLDYEVLTTPYGQEALVLCEETMPELVILEILLPDINGYEVCRRLRDNPLTNHIPVIFLTVKGWREAKLMGLELGAVAYITKPFDPEEVKLRVRNIMKGSARGVNGGGTGLPSGKLIED